MTSKMHFIDWNASAFSSTCDWLESEFWSSGGVDLSRVTIVVPGGRSSRRLLEVLAGKFDRLIPPRIVTLGSLPELFYTPSLRMATGLESRLA
ncbi:MAG: hypothetical protein JKX97_06520 [Candidatus Lindowbacteria bacterium]|nr:hypothetical protein [Candidatus Lindowbacteria bacterium]